jgi:hypothetical protein
MIKKITTIKHTNLGHMVTPGHKITKVRLILKMVDFFLFGQNK